MAKSSAAASPCAKCCTSQDIEMLTGNEAFGLACRIRAAFGSRLFVLPPLPDSKGNHYPLFLGNAEGFPVLSVRRQGGSTSVAEAEFRFEDYSFPLVDSGNQSYVVARTKLKAKYHVHRWTSSYTASLYRNEMFEHVKWWLKAASRSQQIELGKTIVLRANSQQYLIRLYCGSVKPDVFPTAVAKEIKDAHGELLRTEQFVATTREQFLKMFSRQKWLARDMGAYVIVAGLDTSSLWQVAQEIASSKTSIDSAFFFQHEKNISVRFTHEPRAYRSFDQMPDDVRGNFMSSLAFVKSMLLQDPRIPPSAADRSGFLGLPFYCDHDAGSRIVSVDGGWVFKCGNSETGSPVYGQTLMMDKD
jgi:hypothetical protein